eukprot:7784297-Lingulodinium_polyedra.AAC.1
MVAARFQAQVLQGTGLRRCRRTCQGPVRVIGPLRGISHVAVDMFRAAPRGRKPYLGRACACSVICGARYTVRGAWRAFDRLIDGFMGTLIHGFIHK